MSEVYVTSEPTPSSELERIVQNVLAARAAGRLSALGACVFAGGFSIGVEEAGFDIAGHFELPDAAIGSETSRRHGRAVVVAPLDDGYAATRAAGGHWPQDQTTLHRAVARLRAAGAVPDFLYMNPPCSAFAKQGARKGLQDDVMRFTEYCNRDLGTPLQPTVFAWELVTGVFDHAREYIDALARHATEHGYKCYAFITSSALHSGFQNRVRFHFVASKVELDFDSAYAAEPPSRRGFRTLGDALFLVERSKAEAASEGRLLPNHDEDNVGGGALIEVFKFTPPGAYLRDIHDDALAGHYKPYGKEWEGTRGGVTQVRGRRDRVCPVIIGGHSVIHPDHDRFLTTREAATVMGFPMDYEFAQGTSGDAEVGKGLCSHNARFLALAVRRGIEAGVPAVLPKGQHNEDYLTVVDWRGRAEVPPMPSSPEERQAWWLQRHGDPPAYPLEWATGQKARFGRGRPRGSKNKVRAPVEGSLPFDSTGAQGTAPVRRGPGRPPGSGNKGPTLIPSGPKRIVAPDLQYVAPWIEKALTGYGATVATDLAEGHTWTDGAASADGLILCGAVSPAEWCAAGVALHRRIPVVLIVVSGDGKDAAPDDLPSGLRVVEVEVQQGADRVAIALGIDVAKAAKEKMEALTKAMSPEQVLAMIEMMQKLQSEKAAG